MISLVFIGNIQGVGFSSDEASHILLIRRRRGGSLTGRLPNKQRLFTESMHLFNRMYFNSYRLYDYEDFETRFRIPRELFERICGNVTCHGIFQHRRGALNIPISYPRMLIILSLRII